jgi:hypothetical protein
MSAFTHCDIEEHIPERRPYEKLLIVYSVFTTEQRPPCQYRPSIPYIKQEVAPTREAVSL